MWYLVFAGELATGFRHQEVIENLASLLGRDPDDVEQQLFTGEPVQFRRVDTLEEAQQWRADFAKAGALLMVLPSETAPGGGPYAGADPAGTNVEEPTLYSIRARLPAIRRRNRAFMIMGAVALSLAFIMALLLWLSEAGRG